VRAAARDKPAHLNSVAVLLGVSFLVSAADFTVYTYISPLLAGLSGRGDANISGLLLLYGCSGIIGNVAGGQLGDRWGTRKTVMSAVALLALSTAAMSTPQGLPILSLLVALWGIGGWMVVPALQSELMRLRPEAAGMLAAANASAIYAGIAVGSLIGGVVVSAAPVLALGPCASGLALLAFAAYSLHWLTRKSARLSPGKDDYA
jgi:DHA1 family purine base/nucleoside efflux pump-like MFS transporter